MSGEQILRIFAIRRWWILACIVLGCGLGLLLALTLPRVYDAKAQVIVSIGDNTDISVAESATYIDDRMPTMLEISRSADFAEKVAASPGIDLSSDQIRNDLDATVIPETTIIEIHASNEDLRQARTLANTAAETMTEPFVASRLGSDNGVEVEVLQRAETGTAAVFPNPLRFFGIGALAGLALGLVVALLRHGFDRQVRDSVEIRSILDAEMLAVRMRRPSRGIRRQLDTGGAATSTHGLLARLGLIGSPRSTLTLSLVGIGGAGADLAVDLVKTAATDGMRCALVTIESTALSLARARRLSAIAGVDVVDASADWGVSTARRLRETLDGQAEEFDLIVCLSTDLVTHPETCSFLDQSDFAVVAVPPHPVRAQLRASQKLLGASELPTAGFVLVDTPTESSIAKSRVRTWTDESPESSVPWLADFPTNSHSGSSGVFAGLDRLATNFKDSRDIDQTEPEQTTMPIDITPETRRHYGPVAVTPADLKKSPPALAGRARPLEGEQS
jgi:capsular polysaccharide biosynthesis protein